MPVAINKPLLPVVCSLLPAALSLPWLAGTRHN